MKLQLLKKSSTYEKKHLPFPVYLSYCLIIALLLTSVTSARYLSSMSGSDNADVAKWVVDVEYDSLDKVEMKRPSDDGIKEEKYSFSVKNYKDNVVSEVALKYDIVIILNEDLPTGVTIKLNNTELSFDNKKCILNDVGIIPALTRKSIDYELSFIGDFDTIGSNYTRNISIRVDAEQID